MIIVAQKEQEVQLVSRQEINCKSLQFETQRRRRKQRLKDLPESIRKILNSSAKMSPNLNWKCSKLKQMAVNKKHEKLKQGTTTTTSRCRNMNHINNATRLSSPVSVLQMLTMCVILAFAASGSQSELLEPSVLALRSDKQQESSNVILIKYANVSKDAATTTGDSDDFSSSSNDELQSYKLYEPLSVNIIESRFANSIKLFDVSHNQLSTLSKDLFCPLSNEVRQLNISHNLLENFDCLGLISQAGQLCLSELRILDMSYNLVKHLPATGVATLHNLEILNLSHNQIDSLDELSLSSLFKLTKLDLSYNKIIQLPIRIFHKSSSMKVLNLKYNYLQTSISQMFLNGLISLEELNLSYNNISHINDSAFLDKINLTRVDLTHNQLTNLRQEALRVSLNGAKLISSNLHLQQQQQQQQPTYRHRLHHNGQYAGLSTTQPARQQQMVPNHSISVEFLLASNPFICDCQLEWLRKFQPSPAAIKRPSVLSSSPSSALSMQDQMLADQGQDQLSLQLMQLTSGHQNDQPPVIVASTADSSNNSSEILSNPTNHHHHHQQQQQQQTRPMATLLSSPQQQQSTPVTNQQQQQQYHYARIADLDLVKCAPLFKRNGQRSNNNLHNHNHHHNSYHRGSGQSRGLAPSDGIHHNHHANLANNNKLIQDNTMIDLLSADSSNFLCRYKSHCFALCHCCEFDACDCEMICPNGCNCYYDSTWQTNIIDCSSNNHTVVPDRIPMDVSGLYLDGNNIDSLKPSNLIARKSLKTLYLNSSNLQYIANRTFNGLIELQTLYLNDNMLRSLNGYEFEPLSQLRALYLQSNRLDYISNQTFIYLRSLEILDLSNNRLTSQNLDLFWSIGHHNIRLRQLSIAHNWWSCQCSSINRFRQILKQKFLLNGSVNIADKSQLRCYYNSTTVGPLVLGSNSEVGGASGPQYLQPLFGSYNRQQQQQIQQQQQQLTEINQCSELIDERQEAADVNPPQIQPAGSDMPAHTPPNEYPNDPFYPVPEVPVGEPSIPLYGAAPGLTAHPDERPLAVGNNGARLNPSAAMPLTSFVLLCVLLAFLTVLGVSALLFVRQQQLGQQKKSSAGSTSSGSSASSSGKRPHAQLQHHLIMSGNGSNGVPTTTTINQLHLRAGSSQSNIYAALVSPGAPTSSTLTASGHAHNLYSNSSTTNSHHSSYQQPQLPFVHSNNNNTNNNYNQLHLQHQLYNGESHYAINSSYKSASLYNAPDSTCNSQTGYNSHSQSNENAAEWMRLPKVKQFMSKLVNKSLALSGYRSCSRDELSNCNTSSKIYDAFISYDKRDQAFVMQHLSAELEYGQPQFRIADRFRDLPLPTSTYIAEAITSVIGCSQRTIIVLTENYLQSEWCRYELQAALNECQSDKSHKIIAVLLEPNLELDAEMRALLSNGSVSLYNHNLQIQPQLVQLDNEQIQQQQQQQQHQLVATLTNQRGANLQVSSHTANARISFINFQDRNFWLKLKQLMPTARLNGNSSLTLTTHN